MARRVTPAALLTLTLAAATLNAQSGAVQSNLPAAGFDPPPGTSTPAASPAPAATPTIHVFSRETIVDVLVTDDKGQPVRGLTRNDFTVEEDGKPLPLRGFSETSAPAPTPPPPLPPNTYTNAQTLPATGPVQIILFDRNASAPIDLQRSKQYIAKYLRSMPRGTQTIVFELFPEAAKGLVLLQDCTTDGNAAAAVVENLDVDWLPTPGPQSNVIAAAHQIAAYVAGIKGRKNLIWILKGSPPGIVHDGGLSWPITDMVIVQRNMDLYDIFTREQIAIYPFDPRGVHNFGKTPFEQLATLHTLEVADATGGAVSSNSNDYQASLADIVDKTTHGYTLSYVPPRPEEDNHFHAIAITVDRPGVHLSYRTGYNDEQPNPPDQTIIHDMIQGPMRLGALPATQLLFTLQVTPVSPDANTDATAPPLQTTDKHHVGSAKDHPYNAVFAFDPTQIAFSETPDGERTAKLEFDLGVFDSYSQLGPVRSQVITLNVNPSGYDDFMRKPFRFTLPIPMPPGKQTLRAGLFDTVSGKAGTLQIPLDIPKK